MKASLVSFLLLISFAIFGALTFNDIATAQDKDKEKELQWQGKVGIYEFGKSKKPIEEKGAYKKRICKLYAERSQAQADLKNEINCEDYDWNPKYGTTIPEYWKTKSEYENECMNKPETKKKKVQIKTEDGTIETIEIDVPFDIQEWAINELETRDLILANNRKSNDWDNCYSTEGDLEALGWCYKIEDLSVSDRNEGTEKWTVINGAITLIGFIKNVGETDWRSKIPGHSHRLSHLDWSDGPRELSKTFGLDTLTWKTPGEVWTVEKYVPFQISTKKRNDYDAAPHKLCFEGLSIIHPEDKVMDNNLINKRKCALPIEFLGLEDRINIGFRSGLIDKDGSMLPYRCK